MYASKKRATQTGKCEQCGEPFPKKRLWQRFCSSQCRWQNWFDRTYVKKVNVDKTEIE